MKSLLVIASLACVLRVTAQEASPASRLEVLDQTYNITLKRYHAPIIQEYLRDLAKLKKTLGAQSNNAAIAVQAEIDRVQKGSGTLSYDCIKPRPPEDPARKPEPEKQAPPSPPQKKTSAPSLVLAVEGVTRSSPDARAMDPRPEGKALPIGIAEWRIPKLAAGDYRVSILYSSPASPEGVNLQVKLGANTVQHALAATDATGGINEFRIARLGVLSLEADALDQLLTLQNSDTDKTAVWVKQVILAKK